MIYFIIFLNSIFIIAFCLSIKELFEHIRRQDKYINLFMTTIKNNKEIIENLLFIIDHLQHEITDLISDNISYNSEEIKG